MGDLQPGKIQAYIDVTVDAEPYKYETDAIVPTGNWQWNPFSFRDGITYNTEYTISGTQEITLANRGMRVSPTFTLSAPMTISFEGVTYSLPAGETTVYDILLDRGGNVLTVTGDGTLTAWYRGGAL